MIQHDSEAAYSPTPDPEGILADPAASEWLKSALRTAARRDPVDALNDALLLAAVLEERLREELGLSDPV